DLRHVVVAELEVEQLEVLLHAGGRHRLREDDVATMDMPAEDDLRRRAVQPARDLGDHGIAEDVALGDRRPCLRGDPVGPAVGVDLLVAEVGMQLDLVDRRGGAALRREARTASRTPCSLPASSAVSMWRYPVSSAVVTAAAVSPGSIWNTPKPSCGRL